MRIKVPYALNLLFPIIGWALLCGVFSYVLILAIAKFEKGLSKEVFIFIAPVLILIFCFIAVLRYGGISLWSREKMRIVNKNISEKGIVSGLTTAEIKETFDALVFVSRSTYTNVFVSILSIIILLVLIEWVSMASIIDLLIIIVGGIIAMFFAGAFATFFSQQAMFSIIKDCRRMLIERGEKMENNQLSGLGYKFYFLFILPFFTVLITLIVSFPLNLNIVIISLIGLIMTFIIDRVLFVYLSNSLRELERFANELPRGERTVFATGSLDKEIVNLAENLNSASEEIHSSQKKLGKSQEEMEKRVKELEKFFELTINREVKMIELKKEINKLKGNVQENDA
jgi:methyl-accepting chemotaxis protein